MSKPIAVIYFPQDYIGHDRLNLGDLMNALNGESNPQFKMGRDFTDYYWFCFLKYGIDAPEFKVFHEKDFTEIQYAELKELVMKSIKESKKSNQ